MVDCRTRFAALWLAVFVDLAAALVTIVAFFVAAVLGYLVYVGDGAPTTGRRRRVRAPWVFMTVH
ncbi:hypothetical protein ACFSUH_21055 [Rhodococcus jostii]|uniref:hypothetical protein n=1 Tax=Rhodococcus jostii TaxID=132919 RepID=UPI001161032D